MKRSIEAALKHTLPAALAAGTTAVGSFSASAKVLHSPMSEQQPVRASRVYDVARKYAIMIERLRNTPPRARRVSNRRGCTAPPYSYPPSPKNFVTKQTVIEATNVKSGYILTAIENKDRHGKASSDTVAVVDIQRLRYTDCEGDGRLERLDFAAAGNLSTPAKANWNVLAVTGALAAGNETSYSTRPNIENPNVLTAQAFGALTNEADKILHAARERLPVTETRLPHI